jgi:putative PIG3 family NAD(P)H quinone oxidoreductase
MKAVTIVNNQLVICEHPDPTPGKGELLVKVRACGINGADLLQLRGHYPPPPGSPADIPGLEFAGEVVEAGTGVTRFGVGDRVMALVGGGGQAELVVVHERHALPVPPALDWASAGGFPEVFTTAHDALFTQAQLQMGERVLVQGGAGGVGSAAIQLARAAGADVTATVHRAELHQAVHELGATVSMPQDVEDHQPFDVILELVGAPNFAADLGMLAQKGRIVVIGVGAGRTSEINLLTLMGKRGRIHGSTLRSRSLEDKAVAARAVQHHVLPLLRAGKLTVPVFATYPLAEAAAAYQRFAQGGKFGKIVLVDS